MNSLTERFRQYISGQGLFHPGDTLLLAVSGGVDSVVLCELCKQSGYSFVIAHCNFQLRGEESVRDEQFVRKLAESYNVPFLLKRFDTAGIVRSEKISVQVAARELRYEWFQQIPDVDYILTAHHADDNIETVMMNFFKGTGISGLHGILPKQGRLIRPLLFAWKKEILAFAQENNLTSVEDSSNASDKYTRNYFRNQLIPSIEKVFPAIKENLKNSISRFRDAEVLYMQSIEQHKKRLLEYKDNEIHIPILKLKKSVPVETILYEIIKEFGFSPGQVKDVLQIADSETGRFVASSSHRIIKNRNWLIISLLKTEEANFIVIDKEDKEINFPGGRLEMETRLMNEHKLNASAAIAQLDADTIQFPLLLRRWRQGDYFYPLGMKKKKKLSRFFIDQKLSIPEKENIWVVEMNKKIIWIAGKRIDERFKITPATGKVLSITFTS